VTDDNPLLRTAYVGMAAIAGAVTALAFQKWKEMTPTEIVLTLVVGASFAIFVVPLILHLAFGLNETDIRTIAGITYISASGSNTLIPLAIRWLGRVFGADVGNTGEKP
jgi:hypothetical protein